MIAIINYHGDRFDSRLIKRKHKGKSDAVNYQLQDEYMQTNKLEITAIPAFSDNYIWLLHSTGKTCAVVDPGDENPVLEVLQQKGLDLSYILLTHHHYDHTDGVAALKARYGARVFGPADDRMPYVDQICRQGDKIELPELGINFSVLEVPAHTRSHIAFYGENAVFSGDTLFSLGCGRFFEGTALDMQTSLDKLAALPAETRNYCAHEYTQSNCAFALQVEPDNEALKARAQEINRLRSADEITLPTRIGDELATNPFLRTREADVIHAARRHDPGANAGVTTMAAIRAWKDRF
jgi:hydroxyacylglutathione hydrolase